MSLACKTYAGCDTALHVDASGSKQLRPTVRMESTHTMCINTFRCRLRLDLVFKGQGRVVCETTGHSAHYASILQLVHMMKKA